MTDEETFAIEQERTVFAHYTQIATPGLKTLEDGQVVSFEVMHGPKGLMAQKVTCVAPAEATTPPAMKKTPRTARGEGGKDNVLAANERTGTIAVSRSRNRLMRIVAFGFIVLLCAPASAQFPVDVASSLYGRNLVVKSDGSLWAWGYMGGGFGVGIYFASPTLLSLASLVVRVGASIHHTVLLNTDGTVREIGGLNATDLTPYTIPGITDAVAVAACDTAYNLVVRTGGTVWEWGYYGGGVLTNPPLRQIPVLTDVVAVAGGGLGTGSPQGAFALKSDGSVWAWLINYASSSAPTAIQISGLSEIVAIAAGRRFAVALKNNGTVWTWGDNSHGELGYSTPSIAGNPPAQLPGVSDVVAIAAGSYGCLALKADGTVLAWGEFGCGPLFPPSLVPGLSDVVAIAASYSEGLALRRDGTVWQGLSNQSPLYCGPILPTQVSGLGAITPVQVKLSFKRVHNWQTGAYPSAWSDANLMPVMNQLNAIYSAWGSNIQFMPSGPTEDILDPAVPGSISWYNLPNLPNYAPLVNAFRTEATKDPCRYKWRTDAVNVFLVNQAPNFNSVCIICSVGPAMIMMRPAGVLDYDSVALAHELGHFLGLSHTHANHEPADPANPCPAPNSLGGVNAIVGDGVADTINDANPGCPGNHNTNFQNLATAAGFSTPQQDNILANLMSYHGPLSPGPPTLIQQIAGYRQAKVTSGQVARMWARLPYVNRVMQGASVPTIASVTPAAAVYPGPTTITITGTSFPTANLSVRTETQFSSSVVATSTQVLATFPEPLEPGAHCVGIWAEYGTGPNDDDLLAFMAQGIIVTPTAELTVNPAATFGLTVRSTVPNGHVVLVAGFPLIGGPVQIPGYSPLYLNPDPGLYPNGYVLVPVVTGATGNYAFPSALALSDLVSWFASAVSLPTIPSGQGIVLQGLEEVGTTWRLTNGATIRIP